MLYPMFAMVILTLIVGIVTIKHRFASVKSGAVKFGYFQLMQGQDIPDAVTKTTRCFNNMFEVPVLFYAAGVSYLSLGVDSAVALTLAWGFVVARCVQAFVHLSYNNVIHRMLSFWFSLICAAGLWCILIFMQN